MVFGQGYIDMKIINTKGRVFFYSGFESGVVSHQGALSSVVPLYLHNVFLIEKMKTKIIRLIKLLY